ncbi:MAG: aldo/keto reductase [Nitrospiraceae bacterium]|nr:aldo/keto reductase [Nitrospiraceae bacterium]
MANISRRAFLGRSAGLVAAAWAGTAVGQAGAEKLTATTIRTLGDTGIRTSLLGMGTGVKAWGGKSALTRKGHEAYMTMLKHAYELGVRYFDMADMYGSHPFMKEALADFMVRDKVMLLTKTVSRTPEEVRADIERFRQELDTDVIDVVLLHCATEPDWPERYKGCMDVLADAKTKGWIRAHGVSCHGLEPVSRVPETDWVDVVLARINPFGIKMDGKPEEVAPILQKAHEAGKGVLGMKIAGEGQCRDRIRESLKYVMGLGCVDAMPIGFLEPSEVDSAVAHIDAAGVA